jgi:hypothetical protein
MRRFGAALAEYRVEPSGYHSPSLDESHAP